MRKQRICRIAALTVVLAASFGAPALAARMHEPAASAAMFIPPSDYGYSTSSGTSGQPNSESTTKKLVRWLHLDTPAQRGTNPFSRIVVLSGTCVMAVWFVIGGVPRRKPGISVVQPATSERVQVFEGEPLQQSKAAPAFLRAFQAKRPAESWECATEAATATEVRAQSELPEPAQKAVAGFVQQWIVSANRESTASSARIMPHEISEAIMESPIDHALMAEVEQYARQLLGKSPGLDLSSFDEMMAAAMAAVDAARWPVDQDELILSDAVYAAGGDDVAYAEFSGWVDQDEVILSDAALCTPTVSAPGSVDEDVLGLAELEHIPVQLPTGDSLELEMSEAASNAAKPPRAAIAQVNATAPVAYDPAPGPLLDQRIIVLGDSDAVLEIEKRILISANARVITFRRWDEALMFADERDFDLLLINGMTEDGWTVSKLHDWLTVNRSGWEKRSAFALSAPDSDSDEFAARTGAWCIVHPFGPKELVSFLQAVLTPTDEELRVV